MSSLTLSQLNFTDGTSQTTAGVSGSPGGGGGATGGSTDQIFYLNDVTVTTDYILASSKNAGTFGPVTINSGVTITVPAGSTWSIV